MFAKRAQPDTNSVSGLYECKGRYPKYIWVSLNCQQWLSLRQKVPIWNHICNTCVCYYFNSIIGWTGPYFLFCWIYFFIVCYLWVERKTNSKNKWWNVLQHSVHNGLEEALALQSWESSCNQILFNFVEIWKFVLHSYEKLKLAFPA